MNCKLALQMEIFIFQFIWKRSGLRLLASFVLFIVCVCPCLCVSVSVCVKGEHTIPTVSSLITVEGERRRLLTPQCLQVP